MQKGVAKRKGFKTKYGRVKKKPHVDVTAHEKGNDPDTGKAPETDKTPVTKIQVNENQKVVDSEKVPQNETSIVNENQASETQKVADNQNVHNNDTARAYENDREETIRKNRAKMKELGITTGLCSPKKLTLRLFHMTSQRRSISTACSASTTAPTRRSLRMMESEHTTSQATVDDEMNVHTDDEEEDCYEENNANEDCDGQSTSKRGRGAAGLPGEWGTTGYKLEVSFNLVMQPEGKGLAKFSSILGVLAKCGTRVPLHYKTWQKVPQEKKDVIWAEIQLNTNVPNGYKKNCLKKLSEQWKRWKSTVKQEYYKKVKEDPTKLMTPPDRVHPEDWKLLLERWQTKEYEAESQRNRTNRQQYEFPHKTGRKSFSNVRLEVIHIS